MPPKKMLQEMAVSMLNDLRNLPQQVTNPNWLADLRRTLMTTAS